MENIDVILLTSVIIVLFVFFIVSIYTELKSLDKKPDVIKKEGGPRTALFNILAELAESDNVSIDHKKQINSTLIRTMADMENEGTYFSDEVKKTLQKQRDELNCEYSGLPSPKAYE